MKKIIRFHTMFSLKLMLQTYKFFLLNSLQEKTEPLFLFRISMLIVEQADPFRFTMYCFTV